MTQNTGYPRSAMPPSTHNTLPPVPSSQAVVPPSQSYDMHLAPAGSSYTGPLLCQPSTNGGEHGQQMLYDNSSGLSHIAQPHNPPEPSMVKKFTYSPSTT